MPDSVILGLRVVGSPADSDCIGIVRSFPDLSVDIMADALCRGQLHIRGVFTRSALAIVRYPAETLFSE